MMRKNISLLVICVLLALSLTALAEEAIPRFITEQQPIEAGSVLDAAASYTLIGYTSPRVAGQSYLDAHPDAELGLDTDVQSKQVTGEQLLKRGLSPLGVSSDGSSALLAEGKFLFSKKGEEIRMLSLNVEKSGGSPQAEEFCSKCPEQLIGVEGVLFSADGRYMLMPSAMQMLTFYRSHPLMVIDAEKGEIFAVRSYEDNASIGEKSSFLQAAFSPDSKQIYYTELAEGTLRLCRYTFETNTHETLLDTGERMYGYPGMAMDDKGTLQCYVSEGRDNYLANFSQENGQYTLRKIKVPADIDPTILMGKPKRP